MNGRSIRRPLLFSVHVIFFCSLPARVGCSFQGKLFSIFKLLRLVFVRCYFSSRTALKNCVLFVIALRSSWENFWVYLGVRTCELFLCFVAIVRVRAIMLTSLFYVTGEFHGFLHRGRAIFLRLPSSPIQDLFCSRKPVTYPGSASVQCGLHGRLTDYPLSQALTFFTQTSVRY